MTDTSFIYNDKLPVWIVPISGWADQADERMNAYRQAAESWKINIEFSSRLGTFNSYKHAPSVAREIEKHNRKTFERYQKELGENWQQRFLENVNTIMRENNERPTQDTYN